MNNNTLHSIRFNDASDLSSIPNESIQIVVTSPPYPMIEMWDSSFSLQNNEVSIALQSGNSELAFQLMHNKLDSVWAECYRVLVEGGIACINIGDATRTINGDFKLYSNHSKIINSFIKLGFSNLPNIIWRKQTNAPNKFMGSGMLPGGAYVTLEHEYILIFRKGSKRKFNELQKIARRESAFFWEERNKWFSDVWDFKGVSQSIKNTSSRERSGAYPFELAYRLINMYSLQGDTVLDPFVGTGTTTLAAIASCRNSVGVEIDPNLRTMIENELLSRENVTLINNRVLRRVSDHITFINDRSAQKGADSIKHDNIFYKFPVMTTQERELRFPIVEQVRKKDGEFVATYIYVDRPGIFGQQTLIG